MKTSKYFSVLSLALIFAGVTAGFSTKVEDQNSQISKVPMIRYQVNVHLASDKAICNTYWIQVTDENGRLVAPAQVFVPGKIQYAFYSESKDRAVRERGTKRVAMLVTDPKIRNLECEINLFSLPNVRTGSFLPGHTYSFDLIPEWDLQTDKN